MDLFIFPLFVSLIEDQTLVDDQMNQNGFLSFLYFVSLIEDRTILIYLVDDLMFSVALIEDQTIFIYLVEDLMF